MTFPSTPSPAARNALRDVQQRPFWLEDGSRPAAHPPVEGRLECDLLVVGGGFTGLWTALRAKERNPDRDVLLVDADRVAGAATGRNGGFVHASLTHGLANGLVHFPREIDLLQRLGDENLAAIRGFVREHGIDCDWRDSGELEVAFAPHQADALREWPAEAAAHGEHLEWLGAEQLSARVRFHGAHGAVLAPHDVALAHPARLAWGLLDACVAAGVRVHEHSRVVRVEQAGAGLLAHTDGGAVRAHRIALATNAARSLVAQVRRRIVPVHDYALVTEPLDAAQWQEIGWHGYEGMKGAGNRFHYARRTHDGRILWGGYDAVYHRGDPALHEHDHAVYARLSEHFRSVFPQLHGIRFSHAWGGVIDTSSRFTPFWVTRLEGRLAAVAGFTGLGVGASRFAAGVMLDLLDGRRSRECELEMVRRKPLPFPPEPARSAVIALTQWSLARADERGGHRNAWLRGLDRIGVGFDS